VTERLYYTDSYLRAFRARVLEASPDRCKIYLDRTAFYPASGGQPFDVGTLGGASVLDVIDEEDRIAHVTAAPVMADEVDGEIDWTRRFDHMQQHTGQHLLSAVFADLLGAPTVSFHLGAGSCTIDIARPSLSSDEMASVERRANEIVFENRPVMVTFADAAADLDLRKPTQRTGTIRVISIQDLDRSACGGTHVHATGEIGPILIRKLDRVRDMVRVEFLCGMRAVERAHADHAALSEISRAFSSPVDETPSLVHAQISRVQELDKQFRRVSGELARERGRQLYRETQPGEDGLRRRVVRVKTLNDEVRAEAQGFTGEARSVWAGVSEEPPSVLLACSADSGIHAGQWLKSVLRELGGRGGGSAALAQGSLPSKDVVDDLLRRVERGSRDQREASDK